MTNHNRKLRSVDKSKDVIPTVKKRKLTRKHWTDAENAHLLNLLKAPRYQNLTHKDPRLETMAKSVNREFNCNRDGNGIRRRLNVLKKEATSNKIDYTTENNTPSEPHKEIGDYNQSLGDYDKANLVKVIDSRADFVYGLMKNQAELIKNYDVINQYHGLNLADLMKLEVNQRKNIINLLENPTNEEQIDKVGILSVPGFGQNRNNLSLVLPLYLSEAKKTSTKNLGSSIHDLTLGVMMNDLGFELNDEEGAIHNFRDLVRYSLKGPSFDLKKVGNKITSLVKKEHKDMDSIYLFEDNPVFYNF